MEESDGKNLKEWRGDHVSSYKFNGGIHICHNQKNVFEGYLETIKDEVGEVIVVPSPTGTHVFKKRK